MQIKILLLPPPITTESSVDSKQNHTQITQNQLQTPQNPYFEPNGNLRNPVFLDKKHRIAIEFGQSVRSSGVENLYNILFIYSQANSLFSLPARLNIELGGFVGDKILGYNLAMIGISQELTLPLFYTQGFGSAYAGLGLGIYIKNKSESRIGSNFTFGERIFIGYNISWLNIELFVRHYSNGTIELPNGGFNYYGVSFGVIW